MSIKKLAIIISTLALVGCGPSEKEVELQEQMDWVEDYPKFAGIGWFSTNEEVKSTMLKQGYTFDKEFEELDFDLLALVEGDPALRQVYKGELLGQNATITIGYSPEGSLKLIGLNFDEIKHITAANFATQLKSILIDKYSEPDEFFSLKERNLGGYHLGWSLDPKLDDSASYMTMGFRADSGTVHLGYFSPVYAKEENLRKLQMIKAAEAMSNQDDL